MYQQVTACRICGGEGLDVPWHFRADIVECEAAYLAAGGRLLFPLPSIDVVTA